MPKISNLPAVTTAASTDTLPVVQSGVTKKETIAQIFTDNLGVDLAVVNGGTGASDASTARTNLGLGTIATQDSNNVTITGGSITGITDLAVADGGTGASTAVNARTNLAVPSTSEVQSQTFEAFTTGGTLTAYTLTPTPAITAYVAGLSFYVTFSVASGASPTLAISGVATPPNLVKQLADGTYGNIAAGEIPINHRSRVTLLSASQALVEDLPLTPGALINIQTFTASGTYTPSVGTRYVVVECQAGGGGSGGCVATTAGQWAAGRPGAGGGYGRKRITSAFSGVTVTVGAGGTAGAAGDNGGGTGGTSSFGALLSCTGGTGGGGSGGVQTTLGVTPPATSSPASGGVATSADLSIPGAPPTFNIAVSNTTVMKAGGGAAYLGPGAAGQIVVTNNSAGSSPAGGYGGGASGPGNANGILSAAAGAVGAAGVVIVWEYA